MDKILIRGLKVVACHGVKPQEKINPQPFIFDADIYFDFHEAAVSDDLEKTINYSSVSKKIAAVTKENCFDLIEKLAYECAYAVMTTCPAKRIDLTVYKPDAPMKLDFDSVGVSVSVERNIAILSLGSSLGDRAGYIAKAIENLGTCPYITVLKTSDIIETEPLGGVAKNKFLNCAVKVETLLSPRMLLEEIHRIEAACDRTRDKHWDDRTLDIDIIFFGDKIINEPDLIIPHPEYNSRPFVLTPVSQISPEFLKYRIK